jgi:hypothetical protein
VDVAKTDAVVTCTLYTWPSGGQLCDQLRQPVVGGKPNVVITVLIDEERQLLLA